MKRYFVFVGEIFYPQLGMRNFVNDANTFEEAKNAIEFYYRNLFELRTHRQDDYEEFKNEQKSRHCEQIYDSDERIIVYNHNDSDF